MINELFVEKAMMYHPFYSIINEKKINSFMSIIF